MSYMLGYAIRMIIDGLFCILTLGNYTISTTLPYCFEWHRKRAIKNRLKKEVTSNSNCTKV